MGLGPVKSGFFPASPTLTSCHYHDSFEGRVMFGDLPVSACHLSQYHHQERQECFDILFASYGNIQIFLTAA